MPERGVSLDRRALDLLLVVLETPEGFLAGSVLEDHYLEAGKALTAVGLLTPAGHEAIAVSMADHDDAPVFLGRSDDGSSFGYFSPTAGWVKVADSRLIRYRARPESLATLFGAQLGIAGRAQVLPLVPDHLWEIGPARIGRRAHRTLVLFGRRLADPAIWRRIRDVLRARPSPHIRILLTSTPPERLPEDMASRVRVVWLPHVLVAGAGLVIDPEILAARLDGVEHRASTGPIEIIGDGREVRLFGKSFLLKKGVTQRRIVMFLYERYLNGELQVSTEEIVAELDLRTGARIRDFFKKSPTWNKLLIERNGTCGFCLGGPVSPVPEKHGRRRRR